MAAIDAVFVVVDVECVECTGMVPAMEGLIAPLRKALARVDPALANVLAVMVRRKC